MKKFFLFAMFLCLGIVTYAKLPGGIFKHVINVEAYSDWGNGYLTVIDPHYYQEGKESYLAAYSFASEDENQVFMAPDCGDIILEINDKSAKNMSPDQFYAIIDTANIFSIKWENDLGETYSQKFQVEREETSYMSLYDGFKNFMLYNPTDSSYLSERNRIYGNSITSISSNNFDFRQARTYDYIITGNDPLNDEKILDNIDKGAMKRDSKSPDILLTVAKNVDESITHTYIPPTSRTINTGSTTTPTYNYFTKTVSYTTKQNYQTIHEGGYTETTKATEIFLELTALDAKKVNDKSISYAPIVWQMTAKENRINNSAKPIDIYKRHASWAGMPPVDRCGTKTVYLYEYTGLVADKNNPALVAEVAEGSRAEKAGFQVGDIISKIECSYNGQAQYTNMGSKFWYWYSFTITSKHVKEKRQYHSYNYNPSADRYTWDMKDGMIECLNTNFKYTWNYTAELLTHRVKVTVIRDKKKVELELQPRSQKFTRFYWLTNEQLEKLRN